MDTLSVITFKLGKNKKRGLFLTTLLSALGGILLLYLSQLLIVGEGRVVVLFLGLISLLITLFCLVCYYYLAKENFTAIYISDEGVKDTSTGHRIGTVVWQDVTDIKIMDDISNLQYKYIVLKVRNPNEYINREPNRSKRRSLELKLHYYGSPVCFSNRALNCTFKELHKAVSDKYMQYKQSLNTQEK